MENKKTTNNPTYNEMSQLLDRGIDDMEAERELPIEEAFVLIADLVEKRKRARA